MCQTYRWSRDRSQFFQLVKGSFAKCFFRDALPIFHPEFGRFMLEATPGRPWGIGFKDLLDVEPNMKLR